MSLKNTYIVDMDVPEQCFFCPASRDCMNLLMVHNILIRQPPPPSQIGRNAHEKLLQEITKYYPCGSVCPLEAGKDVRKLIDRAIKYIRRYGFQELT